MAKYLKDKNDYNPVIRYLEEQAMNARDIMSDEKFIKADKYKQYFKVGRSVDILRHRKTRGVDYGIE